MAPLSTCTRSRLSHIPSYLLRREAGHSGAPTCTPSHTQPLPPQHLAGVLFLSSPASPNEAHAYVLSAPQALLVAANRPKDTGPAHRLLPFFFGTCFGALGLAAWEANAHPAPSSPHQALHTHQGLHTQPPCFSWLGSQPLSTTPTNSANTAGRASTSASTLPLSSLQHLSSNGIDGTTSSSGSSGSAVPSSSSSGSSSNLGSALSALASGGSSLLGSALRWPVLGAWGHHSSGSSPPGAEHTHSASPHPCPPSATLPFPSPPPTPNLHPHPHPSPQQPAPNPTALLCQQLRAAAGCRNHAAAHTHQHL